MAYQGWLLKLGDYTVPQDKFIAASSYKATYNSQDLDSYVDANGHLQRNALDHFRGKVEFECPAMKTDVEMEEFLSNIRRNYINTRERKLTATWFMPELNDYITQDVYMSDPEFSLYGTYDGVIHYNKVRFAFIAY